MSFCDEHGTADYCGECVYGPEIERLTAERDAAQAEARELRAELARVRIGGLTFAALRAANLERIGSSKYQRCEEAWTPAHWMQATVGELGELANLLKKVDRGDFGLEAVKEDVAKELADVQTYLDILALKLGVDLGAATVAKFNEVSERIGSPVKLAALSQTAEQHDPLAVSDHCPECSEPEPECVCGEQPTERESETVAQLRARLWNAIPDLPPADRRVAESLAEAEEWTPKQRRAAYALLRKIETTAR